MEDVFGYDDFVGSESDGSMVQDEDRFYDPDGITETQEEENYSWD